MSLLRLQVRAGSVSPHRIEPVVAGYRPQLSYQPDVKVLPEMRYMQVDVVA